MGLRTLIEKRPYLQRKSVYDSRFTTSRDIPRRHTGRERHAVQKCCGKRLVKRIFVKDDERNASRQRLPQDEQNRSAILEPYAR